MISNYFSRLNYFFTIVLGSAIGSAIERIIFENLLRMNKSISIELLGGYLIYILLFNGIRLFLIIIESNKFSQTGNPPVWK